MRALGDAETREEIGKWLERIKLGEDFRRSVAFEEKWKTWKKYYRNEFKKGLLPVNLVFPLIRSLVPRIYFRDPRVIVTPRKERMTYHAKVVESIDNWIVRRLEVKRTFKRIIQNACLYGTGIGKTGMDSEFGYDPEKQRAMSEFEEDMVEMGAWEHPEDYYTTEYNQNIVPGLPWYGSVNPRHFVVPFGCEDIRSAPWVAHKIIRHIDDVKGDDKYENKSGLRPTHSMEAFHQESRSTRRANPDGAEYVILWEVYDAREKRIKVIAQEHDQYLRNEEDLLQLTGLPFDVVTFNDDDEWFWGISDVQYLEPQQLEINEIRTQYRQQRRNSLAKLLVAQDAISPEDMEKLRSGDIDSIIEVRSNALEGVVKELQTHMNNDLLLAGQTIRQDMRETVGFSRNQMGEFDASTRRTATEASIVNEAAMLRVDERRDTAADMYVAAIRRINQLIFSQWTEERVVQVIGPNRMPYWVTYTGEQLAGDYDLQVDPDAAQPMSSQLRKFEALELLKVITSIPPELLVDPMTGQIGVNIREVIKNAIEQYGTIDSSRVIIEAQPPMPASPGTESMGLAEMIQMMGGGGAPDAAVPLQMLGLQGRV